MIHAPARGVQALGEIRASTANPGISIGCETCVSKHDYGPRCLLGRPMRSRLIANRDEAQLMRAPGPRVALARRTPGDASPVATVLGPAGAAECGAPATVQQRHARRGARRGVQRATPRARPDRVSNEARTAHSPLSGSAPSPAPARGGGNGGGGEGPATRMTQGDVPQARRRACTKRARLLEQPRL